MFEQRQEAAADVDRWHTELALVVLFGVLVVALTASLGLARRRAARLAELGASLARSEALYSTLVNLSGESILALDARGRIEYANPGLHRMLNLDARDVSGRSLGELAFDGNRHALQSMADALLGGDTVRMELTLQSRDRGEVAVLASGVPRTDGAGRVTGAIIVMADISERKADEARIAWLATHDSLTGLPNRSLLVERLNRTLTSAQRYRRRFCLLFIDLDHFKEVNDRMGHHAGDEVLIEASRRMLACLRAADTLARHGGDEFVALLPETRFDRGRLRGGGKNTLASRRTLHARTGAGADLRQPGRRDVPRSRRRLRHPGRPRRSGDVRSKGSRTEYHRGLDRPGQQGQAMIGSIGLIVIGALLLASNLNLFSLRELAELFGTWWPALLIAAGVARPDQAQGRPSGANR